MSKSEKNVLNPITQKTQETEFTSSSSSFKTKTSKHFKLEKWLLLKKNYVLNMNHFCSSGLNMQLLFFASCSAALYSHMYLCSLCGTWRCGFWFQCSQRQTWWHTGSSVQQQRRLWPYHRLWCGLNQTGGEEVVCTLPASRQRSDALQTSGRQAERPRRGKVQPASVSSSRLILCGATTAAGCRTVRATKENNIHIKLEMFFHKLQPESLQEETVSRML